MPYIPALDGLRCFAVLLVVAFHCWVPGFEGGFVGVDTFFVLSGFLITSLLNSEYRRTGRVDLSRFFKNRALRLCPALLLMLVAYIAAGPYLWPGDEMADRLAEAMLAGFYLSDYSRAFWDTPNLLSHTWSLAVEAKFYLLMSVAFWWLMRGGHRPALPLLLLYALAFQWRLMNVSTSFDWDEIYYRLDTHASGLVLGALLAVWQVEVDRWKAWICEGVAIASICVIAVCVTTLRWGDADALTWGIPAAELASGALVVVATRRDGLLRSVLAAKPIVYVGLVSYGIYLWHYPLARLWRSELDWQLTYLSVFGVSLALAAASYHWVERPLRDYRRRIGLATIVAPAPTSERL